MDNATELTNRTPDSAFVVRLDDSSWRSLEAGSIATAKAWRDVLAMVEPDHRYEVRATYIFN